MSNWFSQEILAPLALILASPFFILSGFKQRQKRLYLQKHGTQAEGIIIRMEEDTGMDDAIIYIPVIGIWIDQQWVELRYEGGNAFSRLTQGQIVSVRYNRLNAQDFIVVQDERIWIEWLFGVVGLILLLSGFIWSARL
ncbi:DUF3592 domain-containing protein [Hymenobacter rigui]|uniref:DUF3592 domain-containing protein n=1 Tax=Hymenobacter rigui TaxID=334424 RepID=A0A3R9PZW0_9BACT|nr:DUF3592 domain-containing protein [Hymenobacter rigui]RSK49897.1 hypothetical protein EI291_04425 [Hymenobacter rigui]